MSRPSTAVASSMTSGGRRGTTSCSGAPTRPLAPRPDPEPEPLALDRTEAETAEAIHEESVDRADMGEERLFIAPPPGEVGERRGGASRMPAVGRIGAGLEHRFGDRGARQGRTHRREAGGDRLGE